MGSMTHALQLQILKNLFQNFKYLGDLHMQFQGLKWSFTYLFMVNNLSKYYGVKHIYIMENAMCQCHDSIYIYRHRMIFLLILMLKIGDTKHIYCTRDAKDVHYTNNDLLTL